MRRAVFLVLALLGTCSAAACAGKGGQGKEGDESGDRLDEDPAQPSTPGARAETQPSVNYGASAEENWKLGEEAFADEDYLVAQRYYSYIRNKFPYSQHAAPSALRIGDCQYARDRWIEAIDSYQNFARLYPNHDKVAYAQLRIGLAYYEQIPSDWFILPPSEEKEQTAVRDAERALRDYVERYPKDENIAEGKATLIEVRKKLLAHERYVAGFYKRLDKDRAYVGRLEVIRRDFPDVGLDDELLFEIANAWSKIGEPEKTKSAVKELETKFPASPRVAEARKLVPAAPSKVAPPAKDTQDPKIVPDASKG